MTASWAKRLFSSPGCARGASGFASPCDVRAHSTLAHAQRRFSNHQSKLPTREEPMTLVRWFAMSEQAANCWKMSSLLHWNCNHNLMQKDSSDIQEQVPHNCLRIGSKNMWSLASAGCCGAQMPQIKSSQIRIFDWTSVCSFGHQNRHRSRAFETNAHDLARGFWNR